MVSNHVRLDHDLLQSRVELIRTRLSLSQIVLFEVSLTWYWDCLFSQTFHVVSFSFENSSSPSLALERRFLQKCVVVLEELPQQTPALDEHSACPFSAFWNFQIPNRFVFSFLCSLNRLDSNLRCFREPSR